MILGVVISLTAIRKKPHSALSDSFGPSFFREAVDLTPQEGSSKLSLTRRSVTNYPQMRCWKEATEKSTSYKAVYRLKVLMQRGIGALER